MDLACESETLLSEDKIEQWHQPVSNRVLDFHGDPIKANLVVFSDGNHHMALLHSLKAFHHEMPQVDDIFYATTPPLGLINDGGLWGEQFIVFMKGENVARIYAQHGLQHRRDVHLAAKGD